MPVILNMIINYHWLMHFFGKKYPVTQTNKNTSFYLDRIQRNGEARLPVFYVHTKYREVLTVTMLFLAIEFLFTCVSSDNTFANEVYARDTLEPRVWSVSYRALTLPLRAYICYADVICAIQPYSVMFVSISDFFRFLLTFMISDI